MTKNDDDSLPTEWALLNNLDEATIALSSIVSLSRVLGDGCRDSPTHEDAMFAFTSYLEDCVAKVSTCKDDLFKNYRAKKGIPEPNAGKWWLSIQTSPILPTKKPAAKKAAKKKPAIKKEKSNGK